MSFEGEIGEFDLIERLVELGRENFTGAIRFENDGIIKIVYLKGGDILSASTNDRADSVDEILLRAGKVTREHIKQALSKRKDSETLGDALLGLGFITRKELTWARRAQAIGILRSLRSWLTGQYTIVADYLPKREEGTIFPLPQMLVELIVTEQDRARFERAMDGGSAVLAKASDFDDQFRRLGLNEDAAEIATHVDGFSSAQEIANLSGKDAFNVYKLLEALRVLGLLQRSEKSQVSSEVPSFAASDDFASAGVTDAADAWGSPPLEPAPQFSFEDEPTISAPPPAPAPVPAAAAPSYSWDEPTVAREITREEPAPEMPPSSLSWEDEATTPGTPLPTPPLPLEPSEPAWGFDEAQIETARRAAVPLRSARDPEAMEEVVAKASKPNRFIGALLAAVVIVIVGVGGVFGYNWWKAKNAPAPSPIVATARPRPKLRPIVPPPTATTSTTTIATTTMTIPPLVTTTTTGTIASAPSPSTTTGHVRSGATPITVTPAPTATARLEHPAGGSPLITNSSTGTAQPSSTSSDPLRAKYDAMAQQHAAVSRTAPPYTIQFELVCETASLTKALAAGTDKLWFAPLSYHGRACYRVFWGHYATAAEAKSAFADIPAALRSGSSPVVVRSAQP